MAKLKVYSGVIHLAGNKSGCGYVAATSKTKVVKTLNDNLFRCSVDFINKYWTDFMTGEKVKFAVENPETLFVEYPSFTGKIMSYKEAKEKSIADVQEDRKNRADKLDKVYNELLEGKI